MTRSEWWTKEESERDKTSVNSRAALPRASMNGKKKKGIVEAGAGAEQPAGASNLGNE